MPYLPATHYIHPKDAAEQQADQVQREKDRWRRDDERRGSASERGYGYRWQKTSKGWLRSHPLCVAAQANGLIVPADLVDHIIPHKGDMALFWDPNNWQSLSGDAHLRIKAVLEHRWMLGEIDDKDLRLDRLLPEFYIEVT